MTIQTTISPDGERLVTLTAEEYQDLIDGRDAAVAMREIAAGTMPTVAEADLDAYLAAPTPLALWHKHRGRQTFPSPTSHSLKTANVRGRCRSMLGPNVP